MLRFIARWIRGRAVTNLIRHVLDDWLPPIVRENHALNALLAQGFFGGKIDLDFKEKAFSMSPAEFAAAYAGLPAGTQRYRDSDTTRNQADAIVEAAIGPRVLEVGCGNGMVTQLLAERGLSVTATDISKGSLAATRSRIAAAAPMSLVQAELPGLPFKDKSFDTVVCAHTLEHIPRIWQAAAELARVANRVIVVIPRQRYYRYTIDYHLHFFPSAAPLTTLFGIKHSSVRRVDGDWFYVGDHRPAGARKADHQTE